VALRKVQTTLTAAGEAGSASVAGSIQLRGVCEVYAVALNYTSLPATADVTITDGAGIGGTILSRSNSNTDATLYPRAVASKSADGSASSLTEVVPVAEALSIAVAQGNPGGTLRVTAYVREG
jgi:hypothetical protein